MTTTNHLNNILLRNRPRRFDSTLLFAFTLAALTSFIANSIH